MTVPRSLWPREHGAYAQLAAPLVSALLLAMPTVASVLLAVGAFAAFLANEPLLVVLGHRGPRLRATAGSRAWRRLFVLGVVSLTCTAFGVYVAGPATLRVVGIVSVAAFILFALALGRVQHSLVGELVAACVLPSALAPVAVAAGIEIRAACLLWIGWSLGYTASVIAVHRVIDRHRSRATPANKTITAGLVAMLFGLATAVLRFPLIAVALPLVATSVVLAVCPPSARRLRAIGAALIVASVVSIGLSVMII